MTGTCQGAAPSPGEWWKQWLKGHRAELGWPSRVPHLWQCPEAVAELAARGPGAEPGAGVEQSPRRKPWLPSQQ